MTSQYQWVLRVESRALDGWRKLEAEHPEEMKQCKEFLKRYPANIRVTNGKAKKLKGQLREYYQYDVTFRDRVRYQTDKVHMRVDVVYAGGHP